MFDYRSVYSACFFPTGKPKVCFVTVYFIKNSRPDYFCHGLWHAGHKKRRDLNERVPYHKHLHPLPNSGIIQVSSFFLISPVCVKEIGGGNLYYSQYIRGNLVFGASQSSFFEWRFSACSFSQPPSRWCLFFFKATLLGRKRTKQWKFAVCKLNSS